jgi:hypothetical protein
MNLKGNNSNWIFFGLGILILSITLLFPIGSDLSIFIQGGMILQNGGELYVDYFDVKPPFVYYLFEMLYGLFDKGIIGYRIFDLLYQATFLISSIFIFRKLKIKNSVINIFVITVPLLYTTFGYANIFQVESLFFLPFIWYFYYSFKSENNYKNAIIKGLLLATIFNLKYTLGIVLIADIYFIATTYKLNKENIFKIIVQIITFVFITFLLFLPVVSNGNIDGMFRFMNYMSDYSSYPKWDMSQILYMIKSLTIHFSDNLSLFLFISFLFALILDKENKQKRIIDYGLLYFILLLTTIILERKGLAYHYQRLLPVYGLIASFGISYILRELKKKKIIYVVLASLFILIYSPIPRYINLLKVPYYYFTSDEIKYYNSFKDGKYGAIVHKHKKVAEYLNSNHKSDKVLLMSANGNEMITFLDEDYKYSMAMSSFYLNNISPEEIRNIAFEDMEDSEIIVIVKNDYSPITFFENISSLEALKKNSKFYNYLNNRFTLDSTIEDTFVIYKRNKY